MTMHPQLLHPKMQQQQPPQRLATYTAMVCGVGSPADVTLEEEVFKRSFVSGMLINQGVNIMPATVTLAYAPEHDIEAQGDCYDHSHLLIQGYATVPVLALP